MARLRRIDVVEHLGAEPAEILGTVYRPRGIVATGASAAASRCPTSACDRFAVYAVDRGPDAVVWSVDARPYFRVTASEGGPAWVFGHPFSIVANLAVGGNARPAGAERRAPPRRAAPRPSPRVYQPADRELLRNADARLG